MPDAKSLLPGRAFRSEHAQLRPEPHSIASHGPAPMDPLQTTRMRNGVLYAAEWPCCHDPLRLSLGSEDPFSQPTRSARAVAHPLQTRVRARRARRVRAPPPRAGRRAPNATTLSLFAPREPSRRCRSTLSPTQPRLRASAVLSLFSLHAQPLGCVFLLPAPPCHPSAQVLHSSQPPTNRSVCFYRGTGARPRIGARLPVRKLTPAVRKLTRRLPASGARALQDQRGGLTARRPHHDPGSTPHHAPRTTYAPPTHYALWGRAARRIHRRPPPHRT